jgi:hypothetical protein
MTGWAVLIAFLLTPLACWALLARTKVMGWTFAAVFAAYAIAEGSQLTGGWPFRGEPAWLLIGLPVMTVVALAAGGALEQRELRSGVPGLRWGARCATGAVMSVLYAVAVVLGALAILSIVASGGSATPEIPVGLVMPLGPGLAVTQHDTTCDTGRDPQCEATFVVTSTSGLPGNALQARVRSQLTQAHGWQLSSDGTGGWQGCRHIGGQDVYIQVSPAESGLITIELEGGPPSTAAAAKPRARTRR